MRWTSTPGLKKTEGRLTRSRLKANIVAVRMRKFKRKKRTAKIELDYSFGSVSYPILLDALFAADWNSISGPWKSDLLGSGTFLVKLVPAPKKD